MRCACCGPAEPWTEVGLLFGGNTEMRGKSSGTTITDLCHLSLGSDKLLLAPASSGNPASLSQPLCVSRVNPTYYSRAWFIIQLP